MPLVMVGLPFATIEISVVVPPMSIIRLSLHTARDIAPITLAAGPLKIVFTGYFRIRSCAIRLPSLRTIIFFTFKLYPLSAIEIASTNSSTTLNKRAFNKAVAPLSSIFKLLATSLAIIVGTL